jgi:hypothetical protein
MRPDFAAFILTHGRPERVLTHEALRRHGYTGRIVVVCDDEDATLAEYQRTFEEVVVFDKRAVAARIDEGDNFDDRRAIIYARNASFDIARDLGLRYFIELDDDYRDFRHKRSHEDVYGDWPIADLDAVFGAIVDFLASAPQVLSIAMAQGGDYAGASVSTNWRQVLRKCMNSFVCAVDRPFQFVGRINEDVNTYTSLGARGGVFLTTMSVALQQLRTQSNPGGMTELYLASGTYVKSFYTVMFQPSSVCVAWYPPTQANAARLHHRVRWHQTVPAILDEAWRKPRENPCPIAH